MNKLQPLTAQIVYYTVSLLIGFFLFGCYSQSVNPVFQYDSFESNSSMVTLEDFPSSNDSTEKTKSTRIPNTYIVKSTIPLVDMDLGNWDMQCTASFQLKENMYFTRIKFGDEKSGTIQALEALPFIRYVEPDYQLSLCGGFPLPNDPYLPAAQYSLQLTKVTDAWETYGFGSHTPYVAVIDSGIRITHEEFDGQIEAAYSYFTLNTDNQMEYVGDDQAPVSQPLDTNWRGDSIHGSHVCGIIGALGNNGKGMAGICWQSKLLVYKVFNGSTSGSGSIWSIYSTLKYLADWKVDQAYDPVLPVNMSLGGSSHSYFAFEMIHHALEHNILPIVASGNDGMRTQAIYPAAYQGVIAVGNTTGADTKADRSNYGTHVSLTAPGYKILSTGTSSGSHYVWFSGTSMSAPFITGLVALMLTHNPNLTIKQIRSLLESNADDLGEPGYDLEYGWGRANALKTIQAVVEQDYPTDSNWDYSEGVLTITVNNTNPSYDSGVVGYPDGVPNATVFVYDADHNFVCVGLTSEKGQTQFDYLKPGMYQLVIVSHNHVFTHEVSLAHSDISYTLNINLSDYHVQTLINTGYISDSLEGYVFDTVVRIYDNQKRLIHSSDESVMESITLGLMPGKTYYIGVTPLDPEASGHYSLWVSATSTKSSLLGVSGQAILVDGDDEYEDNDSWDTATSISLDTLYHTYINQEADYYKISLP